METVHVEPPPAREFRPVTAAARATGHRVQVAVTDPDLGVRQWSTGFIASSDVFTDAGREYVHVATEDAWHGWRLDTSPAKPPRCPHSRCWPAYLVYLDE